MVFCLEQKIKRKQKRERIGADTVVSDKLLIIITIKLLSKCGIIDKSTALNFVWKLTFIPVTCLNFTNILEFQL